MSDLAFVDIETTGLGANCDVWEIAIITDGYEYCWQQVIRVEATIDPWVREHGFGRYDKWKALSREFSADKIDGLLSGKHIVGMCPWFDAYRLQDVLSKYHVDYLGTNGIPWHYHLIDCEAMMIGFLAGKEDISIKLPWKSDDLSRAVGIEPPENKHHALEDARWAKRIYECIME